MPGAVRITLADDEQAKTRSSRAWTLTPASDPFPEAGVQSTDGHVVVTLPGVLVEVGLTPFSLVVRDGDGRRLTELQRGDRGASGVPRGLPTSSYLYISDLA